jgi:hypothetical protein
MITTFGPRRLRMQVLLLVLLAVVWAGPAAAQRESQPVDLPDGPASDGFDIDRFSNVGNG